MSMPVTQAAPVTYSAPMTYTQPTAPMTYTQPSVSYTTQEIQQPRTYMEPVTKTIQVPKTVMEDHDVNYEVPKVEMETRTIQVCCCFCIPKSVLMCWFTTPMTSKERAGEESSRGLPVPGPQDRDGGQGDHCAGAPHRGGARHQDGSPHCARAGYRDAAPGHHRDREPHRPGKRCSQNCAFEVPPHVSGSQKYPVEKARPWGLIACVMNRGHGHYILPQGVAGKWCASFDRF